MLPEAGKEASPSMRQTIRSFVYDRAVTPCAIEWYRAILNRVPERSHILDVNIGTGRALISNAHILAAKNISVVGIDPDSDYIQKCHEEIRSAPDKTYLRQCRIRLICADIMTFIADRARLFDHICFNGSFMRLQNPTRALCRVVDMLIDREDGRIFFTQSFHVQKSPWREMIQPKLGVITSIDFGSVAYQFDFEECLYQANVAVVDIESIDDGYSVPGVRQSHLIEARSRLYGTDQKASLN